MKHFEIFTTEKSKKVVKTFVKTLGMIFLKFSFLVSKIKLFSQQNQNRDPYCNSFSTNSIAAQICIARKGLKIIIDPSIA